MYLNASIAYVYITVKNKHSFRSIYSYVRTSQCVETGKVGFAEYDFFLLRSISVIHRGRYSMPQQHIQPKYGTKFSCSSNLE